MHCRAARRAGQLPRPTEGSAGLVVVLGFGNRGRRINVVNRWRARIAVRTARSARAVGASVQILCSGGAVRGAFAEAVLLRDYIEKSLGWDGPVSIESESRSTWENVRNALPWIEAADWVAFASNGLHAEKARVYLGRQRPELAGRLVAADDYRFGEMSLLKPVFAAVGLWKLRAVFHVKPPA
ncbi:YdcF family protein [Curtobacterium sp. MCBA15_016]|uniref:YdcF family protein n=1 Tax=Curtobacterium sp. MCBA15_016 TaxID=1898740 RepID=UPI0026747AA5|nr:YdcF family protein [Curtobacterium sp. MCBA15_016]